MQALEGGFHDQLHMAFLFCACSLTGSVKTSRALGALKATQRSTQHGQTQPCREEAAACLAFKRCTHSAEPCRMGAGMQEQPTCCLPPFGLPWTHRP